MLGHDHLAGLAAQGPRTLAAAMTTGPAGRAMSPGRECA